MPLPYNPSAAEREVFPESSYVATLRSVEVATSKAGNQMYKLTLDIYDDEQTITIVDYLVLDRPFKLKSLALALDKLADFKAQTFDPIDYLDQNVGVRLAIEDNSQYGRSNKVKSYVPRSELAIRAEPVVEPKDDPVDDKVPF